MRISQLSCADSTFANYQSRQNPAFEGMLMPGSARKAREIESELLKKGIKCDFQKNSYVANCVKKTTRIYENLFGAWALPKIVDYYDFALDAEGYCAYAEDRICFNRKLLRFTNKLFHEISAKTRWHPKFNDASTTSSAHVFIHEFAHNAHFHNIERKHRSREYAITMMSEVLHNNKVHDPVGELITRFNLGNYAMTNMNEFIAERITQDIYNSISGRDWEFRNGEPDVNFSNIFSRKWHNKFDSPQAYLDYYTEQVWDGDMKNADEAAEEIRKFLALLDQGVELKTALRVRYNLMPLEKKRDKLAQEMLLLKKEMLLYKNKLKVAKQELKMAPKDLAKLNIAKELAENLAKIATKMRNKDILDLKYLEEIEKKSEVMSLINAARQEFNTQSAKIQETTRLVDKYKKAENEYVTRINKEEQEERERRIAAEEARNRDIMRSLRYNYASHNEPVRHETSQKVAEPTPVATPVTETKTETVLESGGTAVDILRVVGTIAKYQLKKAFGLFSSDSKEEEKRKLGGKIKLFG